MGDAASSLCGSVATKTPSLNVRALPTQKTFARSTHPPNVSKTETIDMAPKTKTTTDAPTHVAECHGVKVPDSPMISPQRADRINAARYEGQEIAGALKVIRPGDHVLELGAGIGLVGAIAAQNGKPAKVLSFEANPNLIEHINALYALNGLSNRIEVRNEVLISAPDAPETLPFHIRNSYLGSSLIDTDRRATTRVDVPTANYAKLHNDFEPDVMLIDIEGGELEFLRHASLSGVRAIVIEFHPEAYGIPGMRECKSILKRAGFTKIEELCTRHVWTCTADPRITAPVVGNGWATEKQTVDNAVVVPPTERDFVQETGVLNADGSYCSAGALWRNGRALTVEPKMPDGDIAQRKGTWLWGGLLWMHFGHFLVESTARLWALDNLDTPIDGILFAPKRPRNGGEVHAYQREFVKLMGTDVPIVCLDAPTRVERLIVPGQGFGLGTMIEGTQRYRNAITRNFAKDIKAKGADKLYISRSQLSAYRGNLIGEVELEAQLVKKGYTIFHPEKHDLTTQIETYKAARQIIAAEGSALHLLAMVAQADQQVAIVVRRPSGATDQLAIHLKSFSGIKPLILNRLTRSWKPAGPAKSRLWMGELDMPALQKDLSDAGFISKSKTKWKSLDRDDVHARLGEKYEQVISPEPAI
jgi:FkbM family methyltransferase